MGLIIQPTRKLVVPRGSVRAQRDECANKIDFSAYVDYSTPPHQQDYLPTFVIADVSDTITRFSYYQQMLAFYRLFPLHEIVEMILSVGFRQEHPGFDEYFVAYTEEKLAYHYDRIDWPGLEMFYEHLQTNLDEEIGNKVPPFIKDMDYVFYRWIDPVSVCLCDNNKLKNRFCEG